MKKNVTHATLGILSALLIGAGSTAALGRAFPKPVRTYEELKKETGLSSPDGLTWGEMAVDVGGKDWPVTVSFRCHADGGHVESGLTPPPATKIFDNLYYVGDADTSAWAVNTPEGIILIDALTTEADAQKYIVNGLKSVGLDPAKIRYILVSHEHGDHYGGAPMLQKLSGARVGMSEVGWKAVEQMGPKSPLAQSPRPTRDLVLKNGETVSLGGTTIRIVETPGHTPGTLSFIVPVSEKGVQHMAAFWGGNGFPRSPADRATFLKSVDQFAALTADAKVDVQLSSHGDTDDLVARIQTLRSGKAKSNPFLVGRDKYLRYEEIYRLCSRARIAESEAKAQ